MNLRGNRSAVIPVLAVSALVVSAAFAGDAPPSKRMRSPEAAVSDLTARAMLDAKVRAAQLHDAEAYCADVAGADMCKAQWAETGGAKVIPSGPPMVARSKVYKNLRALRTCGTTADGRPYESDFVVMTQDGVPKVLLAIWWGDFTFSGAYVEGQEPTSTTTTPPPSLC